MSEKIGRYYTGYYLHIQGLTDSVSKIHAFCTLGMITDSRHLKCSREQWQYDGFNLSCEFRLNFEHLLTLKINISFVCTFPVLIQSIFFSITRG